MQSKEIQIGGNHYKGFVYDPFEIAHANEYDGECLSILKYVMRHELKGGADDLRKAIHIVDIRVDLIEKYGARQGINVLPPKVFIPANNTKGPEFAVLCSLHDWALRSGKCDDAFVSKIIKFQIDHLIQIYYPDEETE